MHALSNITIPGTANKYSGQPAKKMPEVGIYRRKILRRKRRKHAFDKGKKVRFKRKRRKHQENKVRNHRPRKNKF